MRQRPSGLWAAEREAELKSIQLIEQPVPITVPMGLSGAVRVRLKRGKSGTVIKEWKFRNVLTNAFMDQWGGWRGGASSGLPISINSCYVGAGTGSTTPQTTDTGLAAEIGPATLNRSNTDLASQSVNSYTAGAPDYVAYNLYRDFTTSQANGTIAEFGLFEGNTVGDAMLARALPKDGSGNPTTIVKNSSQTYELLWQFRLQPLQADATDTVTIAGVTYTLTYRAMNVAAVGGTVVRTGLTDWQSTAGHSISAVAALLARTATASGTTTGASSQTMFTYNSGDYHQDINAKWTAQQSAFLLGFWGPSASDAILQVGFSPGLTAAQTATFRVSWGRI